MAVWDTSDLVTRVARKMQRTSSVKLTDTELLAIGDEELQTFIAPMVRSRRSISLRRWTQYPHPAMTLSRPTSASPATTLERSMGYSS